jgi:hypothetical protein
MTRETTSAIMSTVPIDTHASLSSALQITSGNISPLQHLDPSSPKRRGKPP